VGPQSAQDGTLPPGDQQVGDFGIAIPVGEQIRIPVVRHLTAVDPRRPSALMLMVDLRLGSSGHLVLACGTATGDEADC
jgi:hypothetical protein